MGYRTAERDDAYKEMFTEQNPDKLLDLLKRNRIDYVGIDDGFRHSELQIGAHENLFASRLPTVFQDSENRFGGLTIYKVPH